jgi:ABC-type uncharacterized transport system auxiliary subunit
MRRALPLAILLLIAAGCTAPAPVPTDHYYRLPPAQPHAAGPLPDGVSFFIDAVAADGLLRERAVAYSYRETPSELHQYRYHHWQDAPGRMVRDHLVDWLRSSTAAGPVTDVPGTGAVLNVLGRLRRFEIEYAGGRPEVVVLLGFRVTHGNLDAPLLQAEYSQREQAPGESLHAAADAFAAALSAIYARLAADISVHYAAASGKDR